MSDQAEHWSHAAASYEREYIDPYRTDVRSPLLATLNQLAEKSGKTAADLGCGIGPLLPTLAERFQHVYAIDFAQGMIERARESCHALNNVEFILCSLADLTPLTVALDVAVAVNSLVMPDLRELEASLRAIHSTLRPGGHFLGIVPAIDAVHYYTMLLLDRALESGMPLAAARQNAAHHAEHEYYDFNFGEFHYHRLRQHFWQPIEVRHRLRRAGFRRVRMAKVSLSWEQFNCGKELRVHPAPWDWFFHAES
jgi:SAM-dependent methyltransferase